MIIEKKYYDKLYRAKVVLLMGTYKDFCEWSSKKKIPEDGFFKTMMGGSFIAHKRLNNGQELVEYIIWINEGSDFTTFMHETLHTVIKILHDRGVYWNGDEHEVLTYYYDYWMGRLWDDTEKYCSNKKPTPTKEEE